MPKILRSFEPKHAQRGIYNFQASLDNGESSRRKTIQDLKKACETQNVSKFIHILDSRDVPPHEGLDVALNTFCESNCFPAVDRLLKHPHFSMCEIPDSAMELAVSHGYLNIVRRLLLGNKVRLPFLSRLLLQESNKEKNQVMIQILANHFKDLPYKQIKALILSAYRKGYLFTIETLLRGIKKGDTLTIPSTKSTYDVEVEEIRNFLFVPPNVNAAPVEVVKLLTACYHSDFSAVNYLLTNTNVDPSYDNNIALRFAITRGNMFIIKSLLRGRRMLLDEITEKSILIKADQHENISMITSIIQKFKGNLTNLFMYACRHDLFCVLLVLIDNFNIDPSLNDNYALAKASERGKFNIMKMLLAHPNVDPSKCFEGKNVLYYACCCGKKDVAKFLLKDFRINPASNDNIAIQVACGSGSLDLVKILLSFPAVDPSANDNFAIKIASELGHVHIVDLLLRDTRVDPSTGNNNAVCSAGKNGHMDVVERLALDARVDFVEFTKDYERWEKVREELGQLEGSGKNFGPTYFKGRIRYN